MNHIAIIDIFSAIFFLLALWFLLNLKKDKISSQARIFLGFAIVVNFLVQISNVLEHAGITDIFDRYEDYVELLFIPFFIAFIFDDHNWIQSMKLKKTESILRKSEKRFRDLTENSSDWIWEIDENNFYTYVSPKVIDLLGYEPDELIGKNPFDLLPKKEKEKLLPRFDQIKKQKNSFTNFENTSIHKNGKIITLETSGVPIIDNNGELKGYRGIARNISARKEEEKDKEKLIQQLQKSLDEIETLRGILPVCSFCKKIRDDEGSWNKLELYLTQHSEARFSHGICPDCFKENYPEQFDLTETQKSKKKSEK